MGINSALGTAKEMSLQDRVHPPPDARFPVFAHLYAGRCLVFKGLARYCVPARKTTADCVKLMGRVTPLNAWDWCPWAVHEYDRNARDADVQALIESEGQRFGMMGFKPLQKLNFLSASVPVDRTNSYLSRGLMKHYQCVSRP